MPKFLDQIAVWWCLLRHRRIRFAGGRSYECPRCQRRYAVAWADRDRRGPEPGVYEQ